MLSPQAIFHGNDDGSKFSDPSVERGSADPGGSKDLAKAITCFIHSKNRLTNDEEATAVHASVRYFVHCMTIVVDTDCNDGTGDIGPCTSHNRIAFGRIKFETETELVWQVTMADGVTPVEPTMLKMTSFTTREVPAYDINTGSHHLNNANKATLCYTVYENEFQDNQNEVKCMIIVRDVVTKKLSRESEFSLGPERVSPKHFAITNQCEDAECKRDRLALVYYDELDTRETSGGAQTAMVKMFAPVDYHGDDHTFYNHGNKYPYVTVVAKVSAKYLDYARPKTVGLDYQGYSHDIQLMPNDMLIRCTINSDVQTSQQCHILHREWNNVWRASGGAPFTDHLQDSGINSLVIVGNPPGMWVQQHSVNSAGNSYFESIGWAILCWKGGNGNSFYNHGRCRLITPKSLEGSTEKFRDSGVCSNFPYVCSEKSNMPPRGCSVEETNQDNCKSYVAFKTSDTFSFVGRDASNPNFLLNSIPSIAIIHSPKWDTDGAPAEEGEENVAAMMGNVAVICWINAGRQGLCGMLMIDRNDNNMPRLRLSRHWNANGGANGVAMMTGTEGGHMFENLASAGRGIGYDSSGSFAVGTFPGIAPTATDYGLGRLGIFGFVCWVKDDGIKKVFCKLLREGSYHNHAAKGLRGGTTLVAAVPTLTPPKNFEVANFGLSVVGIDSQRGVLCYLQVFEQDEYESVCMILTIYGYEELTAGPALRIRSRAGVINEGVISLVSSSQLLFCGKVKTWGSRGVCATIVISDSDGGGAAAADRVVLSMGDSSAFTSTKVDAVSSIVPISATVGNGGKPEAMICWVDEDVGRRKCIAAESNEWDCGNNAALCRSLSSLPQSEYPANTMLPFDGYLVESSHDNGVTWVAAPPALGAINTAAMMSDINTAKIQVGGDAVALAVGKSYMMRVVATSGTKLFTSAATSASVEVCLLLNSSNDGGACVERCPSGHVLPDVAEDAILAWQCVATPAGTYQPGETTERGPLGWIICPAGSWSGIGSNECTKCLADTYLAANESAADAITAHDAIEKCLACDAGMISTAASSSCVDLCGAGSFLTSIGCVNCPIGRYQSKVGERQCAACPPGSVAGVEKSTTVSFIFLYIYPMIFKYINMYSNTLTCSLHFLLYTVLSLHTYSHIFTHLAFSFIMHYNYLMFQTTQYNTAVRILCEWPDRCDKFGK